MTKNEKTWRHARDNYLKEIKDALKSARYPGARSIIDEVRQHLDSRFSELPPESQSWESFQQLINEMGPASDYVDLLGIGHLKRRILTWKKIAVAIPLVLILLVWAWDRGVIPFLSYNGVRTYVIPEMVGASWDQPFVSDPGLTGEWESVDFVSNISRFIPGKSDWKRELYLKTLVFETTGAIYASIDFKKHEFSMGNWTKHWILDRQNKIQAQYALKEIGGTAYLFYPWLSGDVSRRYMPPSYYVMKKAVKSKNTAPADGTVNFDGKTKVFDIENALFEDAVKAFGEPLAYRWGMEEFRKDNLPSQFIASYENGFRVVILNNQVIELRHEGNDGYIFEDSLKIGSTLDEALSVIGPPKETVTGKKIEGINNVLYKDIEGQTGFCYYAVRQKGIRVFFRDYRVIAIYLTRKKRTGIGYRNNPPKLDSNGRLAAYEDICMKDISKIDLGQDPSILMTLQFDSKTVWPETLPAGKSPKEIMSDGKNPGLGVRGLHRQGITGKGVSVAIIDQPLYPDHPEFAGKIAKYIDVGCDSETSMHGPAVASLLAGGNTGTAPGATLYYVAAPSWLADSEYYAKALDILVDLNKTLPASEKIRAVSVSAAPSGRTSPFKKNREMWDVAMERAEKAGILVLDCTREKCFIGPGYYDPSAPDDLSKCKPGFPDTPWRTINRIAVPCSRRTAAQEYTEKDFSYGYWGKGGLSWSIPYATGVLAMGWQLAPQLTGPEMKELLFASAYGEDKIIDPLKFIEMVKAKNR